LERQVDETFLVYLCVGFIALIERTADGLHATGLRVVDHPAALGRAQARPAKIERQRQRRLAQQRAHAAAQARQAGRMARLLRRRPRGPVRPGAPQDPAQQLIGQRQEGCLPTFK